jgi:hypothetical protein
VLRAVRKGEKLQSGGHSLRADWWLLLPSGYSLKISENCLEERRVQQGWRRSLLIPPIAQGDAALRIYLMPAGNVSLFLVLSRRIASGILLVWLERQGRSPQSWAKNAHKGAMHL